MPPNTWMIFCKNSASCDITHETRGTICYGHEVLHLVIAHTRQGVRFVTGIGFCILFYHAQDRMHDLLRASGSAGGTIGYGHWVLHLWISQLQSDYSISRPKKELAELAPWSPESQWAPECELLWQSVKRGLLQSAKSAKYCGNTRSPESPCFKNINLY